MRGILAIRVGLAEEWGREHSVPASPTAHYIQVDVTTQEQELGGGGSAPLPPAAGSPWNWKFSGFHLPSRLHSAQKCHQGRILWALRPLGQGPLAGTLPSAPASQHCPWLSTFRRLTSGCHLGHKWSVSVGVLGAPLPLTGVLGHLTASRSWKLASRTVGTASTC